MTRALAHRLTALAALAPLALVCCSNDPATPPVDPPGDPNAPTYHADVAPILAKHCAGCHVDGGIAPFTLGTYDEAKLWAPMIKLNTADRTMPPWGVDNTGACGTYTDARWLDDDELRTLAAWADADAPEGAPVAPLQDPEPDRLERVSSTITMAETYVPDATLRDDYRCFIVDPATEADSFLTAYEVRPGDARIVHHIVVFALDSEESEAEALARDAAEEGPGYTCFGGAGVGDSRFLAAWAPGTRVTRYPAGTGIRVRAGRVAIMQVHYNLDAGALPDRTAIDLQLEPAVAREAEVLPMAATDLALSPGLASVSATTESTVEDTTTYRLLGVFPHMHLLGRTLRVENEHAGVTSCLVDVPRWDFHWQQFYFYETPIDVRPGDTARLTCTYDTRGQRDVVTWGEGTRDEMCVAAFYFVKEPAPEP